MIRAICLAVVLVGIDRPACAQLGPDFCSALLGVLSGSPTPATSAALPGFKLERNGAPDAFRTETIFIRGNDPGLVPQQVAACARAGRWINPFQRSPDASRPDWFRAMWGMPNGTAVSMSMQYSPRAGDTITVMSFVRGPAVAQNTPKSGASVPTSSRPVDKPIHFRCRDGREFDATWTGSGRSVQMHIRFKGSPKDNVLDSLDEPHSPSANAQYRFEFGNSELPDTLIDLRDRRRVRSTACRVD